MEGWLSEIEVLLSAISCQESLSEDSLIDYPAGIGLQVPSMRQVVESQLTEEQPHSVEELRSMRAALVNHLESGILNKHIETSRKSRSAVSQRTPPANALRPAPHTPSNLIHTPTSSPTSTPTLTSTPTRTPLVEVEVYGNRWSGFTSSVYGLENPREQLTKISTLEISSACTFGELYSSLLESLPSRRSYEGASYAHGGMLLFPTPPEVGVFVNRRGGENYCDYSQYLGSTECTFIIADMDQSRIIDHLPKLVPGVEVGVGVGGFLVHTGQECERIYIQNVRVRGGVVSESREIYRRCIRKISWCVLCASRVAELVVVDDSRLPLTPCFICKDCYRSFRSDVNGLFIDPPDHAGVFLFRAF